MTRRRSSTHLAVALLACLPARAEIRLVASESGAASILTTLTRQGPWTAVGEADATVLNAQGDLAGDGAPALGEADGRWLAAWASPADGVLRIARGGTTWQPAISVRAEDAVGTPIVLRAGEAWVVATRLRHGRLGAVGLTDSGDVSALVDVGSGRIVSAASDGEECRLTIERPDGRVEDVEIGILVPNPQPIDWHRPPHDGCRR